ncbi:MAG: hypothetical protein Q4G01_08070, partial [Eubacteriales bacterium]|nr:hypothetical protein [Eubacteriales bacterium]
DVLERRLPVDYRKELKKKLSASYERQVKQWMASDPARLIEAAEEIAAVRFIHENLIDSVGDEDAAFLLSLDDPLEDMSEKWIEENGSGMVHDDDICHCIWSLQDSHDDEQAHEQGLSTVGAFLAAHPGDNFFLTTPGGYVVLNAEQAAGLLGGKSVSGHPGCPGYDREVTAEELLPQTIGCCNKQNGEWHILSSYPEQEQGGTGLEVTMC